MNTSALSDSAPASKRRPRTREELLERVEQIDALLCAEGLSMGQTRALSEERASLRRQILAEVEDEFSITPRPALSPLAHPSAGPGMRLEVNLANDGTQRVRFTGGDTLTLSGHAQCGGMIPSMICITVAGVRVRLNLTAGDSALQTAQKLSRALPEGFVAEIKGTEPVRMRVLRQAKE